MHACYIPIWVVRSTKSAFWVPKVVRQPNKQDPKRMPSFENYLHMHALANGIKTPVSMPSKLLHFIDCRLDLSPLSSNMPFADGLGFRALSCNKKAPPTAPRLRV